MRARLLFLTLVVILGVTESCGTHHGRPQQELHATESILRPPYPTRRAMLVSRPLALAEGQVVEYSVALPRAGWYQLRLTVERTERSNGWARLIPGHAEDTPLRISTTVQSSANDSWHTDTSDWSGLLAGERYEFILLGFLISDVSECTVKVAVQNTIERFAEEDPKLQLWYWNLPPR